MNYAGNHRFTQNCYCYPHLSRCCPQLKSTYFLSSLLERPLCCLAFITLTHCSVFKVQSPAFTKTRNKYSIPFEYLFPSLLRLVGPSGLEPPTLRLSVVRSSQLSYGPIFSFGGDSRDRTGDLLLARQALSQLSYIPSSRLVEPSSTSLAATLALRLARSAVSPLPRKPISLGFARS